MFANRLSWTFDLRGPSKAIDTACSSSLTALAEARDLPRHAKWAMAARLTVGLHGCLAQAKEGRGKELRWHAAVVRLDPADVLAGRAVGGFPNRR